MFVNKTKLRICIYICLNKLGYNLSVHLYNISIRIIWWKAQKSIVEGVINMILLLLLGLKFNGKIKWDLDRKPVQRDKTSVP